VIRARGRGIACAITSGMACVAFGVAQATKDCDLLCAPDAARKLFDLLGETAINGHPPSYRGHLTAPMDERWFRGGWTSHFVWNVGQAEAYLDVFGVAPRGSSPWEAELEGFYACRHTVAEMKRTNQHQTRVRCAEKYLPVNPLKDYGVPRLIEDAREALAQLVNPAALAWLPEVREHFKVWDV
jgi:hypothetical protein